MAGRSLPRSHASRLVGRSPKFLGAPSHLSFHTALRQSPSSDRPCGPSGRRREEEERKVRDLLRRSHGGDHQNPRPFFLHPSPLLPLPSIYTRVLILERPAHGLQSRSHARSLSLWCHPPCPVCRARGSRDPRSEVSRAARRWTRVPRGPFLSVGGAAKDDPSGTDEGVSPAIASLIRFELCRADAAPFLPDKTSAASLRQT